MSDVVAAAVDALNEKLGGSDFARSVPVLKADPPHLTQTAAKESGSLSPKELTLFVSHSIVFDKDH